MIDAAVLQQLATRYHTTRENAAREYCQHVLLAAFYRQPQSEHVLFKGGTALRILYSSPRFSEDLDFSGFAISQEEIETVLTHTLSDVERLGLQLEIAEAKRTSGGYLGILHSRFLDYHVTIQVEISLRTRGTLPAETTLVASDMIPAYTVVHLQQEALVREKLDALLSRAKPRDFYDVYFLLRKHLVPVAQRSIVARVLDQLARMPTHTWRELQVFLPTDQQGLIKDFHRVIERELRRFLA